MNFPIPPRPDTGGSVSGPILTTVDGRPRSTWGWFEGVGVYLLATIAGGFASLPVLSALGDTSVNGAVGRSEILATIVADVVITGGARVLAGALAPRMAMRRWCCHPNRTGSGATCSTAGSPV